MPTLRGSKVALKEIAQIGTSNGPAFVYHDNGQRFIAVKFSIRDRDMGSTIAEAQKKMDQAIKLDKGYRIEWAGEFENQVRATKRLGQVVPVSLVIIFILLFITFGNGKDAALVLANVPFALIGGIAALHITGVNFSAFRRASASSPCWASVFRTASCSLPCSRKTCARRMSLADSLVAWAWPRACAPW